MVKRLLCIVSSMNTGGAETFLMKIYRNLDRSKYQMDFIVNDKRKGFYDDEIKLLGGKIYYIPPKSQSFLQSFNSIKKIVRDNKYKYVIRVNEHSLSVLDLISAKLGGAKVLAMRSSNAGTDGGKKNILLHKIFKFLPKLVPDVKIAPSTEAAIYTFGQKQVKNGKINFIKNAIPFEQFAFNDNIRNIKRNELGLQDKVVVGHIGRFNEQKNHKFLIEIFSKFKEKNDNAILLLIGNGSLEGKIRKQVEEMNLKDSVMFLGVRKDISELLMAMDVFVFPSFYEGMPNTVIEAQASGVKCIVSDTITKEADITNLVKYCSLNENADSWAKEIEKNIYYERTNTKKDFIKNGYEIQKVTKEFQKIIFEREEKNESRFN